MEVESAVAEQETTEDGQLAPDTHERQLIKRAEILQEILFGAGALAIGAAGVAVWKLIHQPWPFRGLPCIGVAAGVPWSWTIFIHEDQAKEMGAQVFRDKLFRQFMLGTVCGGVAALIAVLMLLGVLMWGT